MSLFCLTGAKNTILFLGPIHFYKTVLKSTFTWFLDFVFILAVAQPAFGKLPNDNANFTKLVTKNSLVKLHRALRE